MRFLLRNTVKKPGMDHSESENSLVYKVSSRLDKAT